MLLTNYKSCAYLVGGMEGEHKCHATTTVGTSDGLVCLAKLGRYLAIGFLSFRACLFTSINISCVSVIN